MRILEESELHHIPILVFCNKQDLPNAMSVPCITEALNLHALKRPWHAQACSATSGDGLYDGLDWLSANISKSRTAARAPLSSVQPERTFVSLSVKEPPKTQTKSLRSFFDTLVKILF